jgi:hypothetical protein
MEMDIYVASHIAGKMDTGFFQRTGVDGQSCRGTVEQIYWQVQM